MNSLNRKPRSRKLSALIVIATMIFTEISLACDEHFYLEPEDYNPLISALINLTGLSSPEAIFQVKHPQVAHAQVGQQSEMFLEYERPWFSRNVTMQLKSTPGIRLLDQTAKLDEYSGRVKVRYVLEKLGFNNIKIQVTGTHRGRSALSSKIIYIQPHFSKPKTTINVKEQHDLTVKSLTE